MDVTVSIIITNHSKVSVQPTPETSWVLNITHIMYNIIFVITLADYFKYPDDNQ